MHLPELDMSVREIRTRRRGKHVQRRRGPPLNTQAIPIRDPQQIPRLSISLSQASAVETIYPRRRTHNIRRPLQPHVRRQEIPRDAFPA